MLGSLRRSKLDGFTHFVLAIHHLGHVIEDHFGNGERLGVNIEYLREQSLLGTAGALSLINPKPDVPFVVTNGDVTSDIRYVELLIFIIVTKQAPQWLLGYMNGKTHLA